MRSLCFFALFAICLAVGRALDAEAVAKLAAKLRTECRAKYQVSDDVLDRATKGDIMADDRNLQCYVHCILLKSNVMHEDGTYTLKNLHDLAPEDRKPFYDKPTKECDGTADPDPCSLAMKLYSCYQKIMGDKFSFF